MKNLEQRRVGIVGVGAYMPPDVRTNDWWPESVVATWMKRREDNRQKHQGTGALVSPGMRRVLQVLEDLKDDPFQGAKERRIMLEGMLPSDMELIAAEQAIERAGIDPREIGLLLSHAAVPDYLVTNNGCLLHERLHLPRKCMTLATDAACNTFLTQLALAEEMILGGRTRYALLVQSCAISKLLDASDPLSPNFGDGATAVVVGPVGEGRGLLSADYRTDGSLHKAVVGGVRGRAWYDEGRVCMYSAEPSAARRTFLEIADKADEVVGTALALAGLRPSDVDFFGVHQGTSWARLLLTDHLGLVNAKSIETFAWAASIFAGNIPLALSIAEKEGILRPGHVVAMFAGGAGLAYSSAVLRWGA